MENSIKDMTAAQIATLKQRAHHPEPVGNVLYDRPFEVLITLEYPVWEFLHKIAGSSEWSHTVEGTIESIIRAFAKDNVDCDFLRAEINPEGHSIERKNIDNPDYDPDKDLDDYIPY